MRVPSIARPTDTPLAKLTAPELFMITSTRLWVAPYRHPSVALPGWREGFANAQLDQNAAASFDTLIRIVAASSRTALDIRWHCCPHLGEAESFLLLCLALWQRKRFNESLAFVGQWLSPPAARVVIDPGDRLAIALLKVGLIVPLGCLESEFPGTEETAQTQERGSRLIH